MKNHEFVEPPFRIMPSEGMRLAESTILILSAAFGIVGWILAVSLGRPTTSTELLAASLPFAAVLAIAGFLMIRRRQRYFGPRGRYWLVIERDRLVVVTPDKQDAYEWRDLTRFVVEQEERVTMDDEKHVERHVTGYVAASDTGPNGRALKIVADDFAAKLPGNRTERAQKFCAILNDVRRWATESSPEDRALSMRTVSGLALAPT